jgi:hypothetical protein
MDLIRRTLFASDTLSIGVFVAEVIVIAVLHKADTAAFYEDVQ